VAIWYWIAALEGVSAKAILFSFPLVFVLAMLLMFPLLLLPEFAHEVAVIAIILCSIILGVSFQSKPIMPAVGGRPASVPQTVSRQSLIKILFVSTCIAFTNEVIRLLAFDRLYETPDAFYMTYCVLLLLTLLTALFFALFRLRHTSSPFLSVGVVAVFLAASIFASVSTWFGHKGLFVLMGTTAFILASFLLPLLFAHRRLLVSTQVVCLTQFGLSLGVSLGFLGKGFLLWVDLTLGLKLEVQILALFLHILMCLLVLLIAIFGMSRTPAVAVKAEAVSPGERQSPQRDFKSHLRDRGLTQRQAEIATLVAKEYSVPSIAEELTLSKKTVGNHLAQAYKALGIHSKQELIRHYQSFTSTE
jgi:DNA-binding CsgD family transcriptional regulator